jgi:hypothetical protein
MLLLPIHVMSEQFRFADLPKELRFIIYDSLPVQSERYGIESQWENCESLPDLLQQIDRHDNIRATYHDPEASKPILTLVHSKFRSLAILRTCRWIASEAGVILQPKLKAMRTLPVRIVVNSWAIKSLELKHVLRCFSHSACGAYSDVRVLLCPGHLRKSHDHGRESREFAYRQIHIAIYNTSADWNTAPIDLSASERQLIQLEMYRELQGDLKKFYMYQCSAGEQPTRDLRIHVRPALLWPGERAAFEQVRPLGAVIKLDATRTTPSLQITGGEPIERKEWMRDWIDSNRVISSREMEDWESTYPCW